MIRSYPARRCGEQLLAASVKNDMQCLKYHTIRGLGGQVGPDTSEDHPMKLIVAQEVAANSGHITGMLAPPAKSDDADDPNRSAG